MPQPKWTEKTIRELMFKLRKQEPNYNAIFRDAIYQVTAPRRVPLSLLTKDELQSLGDILAVRKDRFRRALLDELQRQGFALASHRTTKRIALDGVLDIEALARAIETELNSATD